MNRQLWDDLILSVYVDGELNSEDQHALEAEMARDAALRRQVQELRLVVAALRDAPLREPSRNFLLTPAMVATPQKSAPRARRMPLLLTRWATALSAVAFAIVLTFQLGVGGLTPFAAAPVMAPMMQESAAIQEDTVSLERNMEMASDEIPATQAPGTEVTMLAAPVSPPDGAEFCAADEPCAEPAPMGFSSEPIVGENSVPVTAPPTLELVADYAEAEPAPALPLLPLGLGLFTLLLAGLSWWLSRRQ